MATKKKPITFTKAQAGSIGGKRAKGAKKRRGDAEYYANLRRRRCKNPPQPRPVSPPKPKVNAEEVPADNPPQTIAKAPDPMAALPGETETQRRLRLNLPLLDPPLKAAEPKGFTYRPEWQG